MPDYLNAAIEAAHRAGTYLLENRGKISRRQVDEKARNDFVTFVDYNSEKIIVDLLQSRFPHHNIMAEEGTATAQKTDFCWIIDPLDGTKNFIEDVPMFCVSIALQQKNEMRIAVIYDPVHDELFTSEKGKGAFCNKKPIQVSARKYSESLLATGFPHRAKHHLPAYLLAFEDIFLGCSGMRRCGSAAMDLCYTAMGRFDGFWELGLSPWDVAAGSLIVREAKGVISDFWGEENHIQTGYVVAGNPQTHENLTKILQNHFPKHKIKEKKTAGNESCK